MTEFSALILAAGEGKRMKSEKSKVVHKVCGVEMVNRVLFSALNAGATKAEIVVGHCADMVKDAVGEKATFAYQHQQLGTGHAVMQARDFLSKSEHVCILTGDTPLITAKTLSEAMQEHISKGNDVTVLTAEFDDPTGYGRIIRNENNSVSRIVEHKDASEKELLVKEINSGMYFFRAAALLNALDSITNENSQGEYYLTDALSIIIKSGGTAGAYIVADRDEIMGVNDRRQLAFAEAIMRRRINEGFMMKGVTIVAPDNTYICEEAIIGIDSIIYPGAFIDGKTVIGKGVTVGPNVILNNAVIKDGAVVVLSPVSGEFTQDK